MSIEYLFFSLSKEQYNISYGLAERSRLALPYLSRTRATALGTCESFWPKACSLLSNMAAVFILITTVLFWTAGLPDWSVAFATGLAQLAIWSTLLSLVPFVSIWVSLKVGAFSEISRSSMRTHYSSFLKVSFFIVLLPIL